MRLAFMPLSDVTVIEQTTPDAVAMFETSGPFTIVDFAIDPGVDTLSVGFSHLEVSIVAIASRVPLEALTMAQVFVPQALVLTTIGVFHDASPMALPISHDA